MAAQEDSQSDIENGLAPGVKTIYFVRHGESTLNAGVAPHYIAAEAELTELGRKQSRFIAERAAKLPVEAIIASPWVRAKDTALMIAERLGKNVEFSELFTERRCPTSFVGRAWDDEEFRTLEKRWLAAFHTNERVLDGENFSDLKERALKALLYLEKRPESGILVVSHGFFLRMLLACIIFGEQLRAEEFYSFVTATLTSNTGITMLTHGPAPAYHAAAGSIRWLIGTFNDHAHIG